MRKSLLLIVLIVLLAGCRKTTPLETPPFVSTPPVQSQSVWSIYHPDPDHPWNRLFRQLYQRTSAGGEEYGFAELDPLFWQDTAHLLEGISHEGAIRVLDEFLASRAETLIDDPLKRAMFQRDLWAVFDWLAAQPEPFPAQRRALERRLAQVIKRVALSREEIHALPDNYARAVESKSFPADFQADARERAFLPPGLFQPGSAWVPLGRVSGPVAMTHTEAFPFFGRSVFLVFVQSPAGRQATLEFIRSLSTEPDPVTASGSNVALVRQMLLIDDQGELVLSPLVETMQIRHFSPEQSFYEFELDRVSLFTGTGGGLLPKSELFMLFMGHGDVFENPVPEPQAAIPEICKACHFEYPPFPGSGNTRSIISYSRQPFSFPDHSDPILFPTTVKAEASTVIEWKRRHPTWKSFEILWGQAKE